MFLVFLNYIYSLGQIVVLDSIDNGAVIGLIVSCPRTHIIVLGGIMWTFGLGIKPAIF